MNRRTMIGGIAGLTLSTRVASASRPRHLNGSSVTFYVNPDSNAARTADAWRSSRPTDAAAMDVLAAQSCVRWLGDWNPDIERDAREATDVMVAAGALPVFTAYNIPSRDCGQYSRGGAADADRYAKWIRGYAAGIGNRPAVVVLEPDALAGWDCLEPAALDLRVTSLGDAIKTFTSSGTIDVYVDGGHSRWLRAEELALRLTRLPLDRIAGISLNVSNFQRTEELLAYNRDVGSALGHDIHCVIDTSRNGNGPWETSDPEFWCNPPGRALGSLPTLETTDPLCDAWLWIKHPGESDGECRTGKPSGTWDPEYALGLVNRSRYAPKATPRT